MNPTTRLSWCVTSSHPKLPQVPSPASLLLSFKSALAAALLLAFGNCWAFTQCPPVWITSPAIIDYTSNWKFRPNTNALTASPSDEWAQPDYDDAGWSEGPGLFGYETRPDLYQSFGPFQTSIAPPHQGPLSSYFRKRFQWTGSASALYLNFTNLVDDGMIVYLNGVELFSFNMPNTPRPMTWDGLALATDRLGEGVPFTTNIFAPNLRQGENVIAVELHQSGIASGDNVFGMKMTATTASFDPIQLTQPADATVLYPRTVTLLAEAFGDPRAQFQWYEDGVSIPGATAAVYSFTPTNPCSARSPIQFVCEVRGSLCTFLSRTATIQVMHDDLPPSVRSVRSSSGLTALYIEFSQMVSRDSAEDNIFAYTVSDGADAEFTVLSASLQTNQPTVILELLEPLSEGATYTLHLAGDSVLNLCGLPADEATVSFQAWTRDVPLRITRMSPAVVQLHWADASFGLEAAPSPTGPWVSRPYARSGDIEAVVPETHYFRLRRIPE
ncbi:MAG: hypothetical protein IPK15_16920 [Verrucomicrobia bacterium]|nr:hypothetical protein [Verrucomicrobiota bacterium]